MRWQAGQRARQQDPASELSPQQEQHQGPGAGDPHCHHLGSSFPHSLPQVPGFSGHWSPGTLERPRAPCGSRESGVGSRERHTQETV